GKVAGETAHRGRVRATVVIDDDDQVRGLQVRDLVERFVRHAARQGAVADHGDHETSYVFAETGLGDAERVAQGRRRVAVLDQVVLRLLARRIPRQPARLAKPREVSRPAGDELVDVGLMARVPDDRVLRAVEYAVQGKRELDDAEVGREMAAGTGGRLDQESTDLAGELGELGLVQRPQVGRGVDRGEDSHSLVNAQPASYVPGGGGPRVGPSAGHQLGELDAKSRAGA